MLVLLASVCFAARPPSTAGAAAGPAVFQPTLRLSATWGPVGSTVIVTGTSDPSCAGLVFRSPSQTGGSYVLGLGEQQTFRVTFVIPSYIGLVLHSTLPMAVVPGRYEFEIECGLGASLPRPVAVADAVFTVTSSSPSPGRFVGLAATSDGDGYWLAQASGGVLRFGDAAHEGSLAEDQIHPAAPVVGIASTPTGSGYWVAGADGGVFSFGDARFYGSLPGVRMNPIRPIVGITSTPDGHGYWLVGADGGVFAFGDAQYLGSNQSAAQSPFSRQPAIGLVSTPGGDTYYVANDEPNGGMLGFPANAGTVAQPVADTRFAGVAVTPGGRGFWFATTEGGVFRAFSSGNLPQDAAGYFGSLVDLGVTPNAPIVGVTRTPDGQGYWLAGADGGVFAFGDAAFHGSAA